MKKILYVALMSFLVSCVAFGKDVELSIVNKDGNINTVLVDQDLEEFSIIQGYTESVIGLDKLKKA